MSIPLARPDVDPSPARGGATTTARALVLTGLGTVGVLHIVVLAAVFAGNRAIAITYLAVMLSCLVVAAVWRPAESVTETRAGTTGGSDAHPLPVDETVAGIRSPCARCLSIAADQPEGAHRERSAGRKPSAA